MNNEPKNDSPPQAPADEKKAFSMRKDMAKGLRLRTAIRAGFGTEGNTQPQRDGAWTAGLV